MPHAAIGTLALADKLLGVALELCGGWRHSAKGKPSQRPEHDGGKSTMARGAHVPHTSLCSKRARTLRPLPVVAAARTPLTEFAKK